MDVPLLRLPGVRRFARSARLPAAVVAAGAFIVPDYDGWRRAFDSDPLDRKGAGVRRFKVFRSVEDPNYVLIDLELETLREAEALLSALHTMWGRVEGTVMSNAHAHIILQVDGVTL